MKPRHIAIASGLALTLTFGAVQATTSAFAEPSASADADAATTGTSAAGSADSAADDTAEQLPAPADYDKADFYESAPAVSARSARSASSLSLSSVSVSSEMKYFTKYESHSNYRQGFSYGDGYNALGYYQFDRRYSLIPFLTQVYNANPTKYSMLKAVIDRGSEVKSASSMYDSGSKTLTELGQLVQSAWYAAYDADPAEFSSFQDAYAYNSYYVPTERWLKSELGIDMSGRADCVKGMVWGLSNMWGTGGVKKVLRGANLSNDMTDREFVTALSAQMTDNIEKYSSQTQYYKGWKNRYKNELNDCLAFISLHEAEDEAAGGAAGSTDDATNGAAGDSAGDTGDSAGDAGAGSGSDSGSDEGTGDSAGSGSNSGTTGGSNDGASGSGSNGAGSAGDSAGSGSGSADDAPSDGATAGGDTAGGSGGSSSNSGSANNGASNGGSSTNGATDDSVAGGSGSNDASNDGASGGASNDASNGADADDSADKSDGAAGDASSDDTGSGEDAKEDASSDGTVQDESSANGATTDTVKQDDETASKKEPSTTASNGDENASDDAKDADPDAKKSSDEATDGAAEDAGGRMPQTSDLVMFAGFAGASAATFGATFIAAGKLGLKRRKDDDAE
ncbi:hypothetical protein [Enorma massiliensis]|uniref:hypothetical protein n=1 Tax=Enorma massiliensis TaxID=1472761 RepID=UPI0023F063FD|nr:hypothetical protein [Enorma massiliensis]